MRKEIPSIERHLNSIEDEQLQHLVRKFIEEVKLFNHRKPGDFYETSWATITRALADWVNQGIGYENHKFLIDYFEEWLSDTAEHIEVHRKTESILDKAHDYTKRRERWQIKTDIPLYHGTRRHLSPEEIKKQGFQNWVSSHDAQESIREALRHFGKEHLIRQPERGRVLQSLLDEVSHSSRHTFSTTGWKGEASGWARRSPEMVYLALHHVGIPNHQIESYLKSKYGTAYVVKLNINPSVGDLYGGVGLNDVHLSKGYIAPEEIESVTEAAI